jgi:probable phosphoglycerate mutase
MATTRVILLRHGQTQWNAEGRYQGQLDSPLSSEGLSQAAALAARMAKERFSALYTSDLGRAHQTAQIIARQTGHDLGIEVRLRERHLGIFQGLLETEIRQRYPREHRRWEEGDPDYVIPGGESARQHFTRSLSCLEELAQSHFGERIVIVTHAGVLEVLLQHTLGISTQGPRRYKRRHASWNLFSYRDHHWFLETWGDLSHLADK